MPRTLRRRARNTPSSKRPSATRRPVTAHDLLRFVLPADPQISPDGNHIVFVRKHVDEARNESVTNLWLANANPRQPAEPVQYTAGNKDSHPRFSPDGTRIAFISAREKTRPQIHLISAPHVAVPAHVRNATLRIASRPGPVPPGGESRPLTQLPEGSISSFKWSPDGRSIVVMFRAQDPEWTEEAKKKRKERNLSDPPRVLDDWWYRLDGDGYFNAQRYHLLIVDVATGRHRTLYARDAMGDISFDFSPDSSRLAVTTNRHPMAMVRADKCELLIIDVATGRISPQSYLPGGPKLNVAWSPDGRTLAYAGRIGNDSAYGTDNLELFVCDPRERSCRSLTGKTDYCLMAAALTDLAEADFSPRLMWTPDSRRIVFRLGWHGCSHVASLPARGGRITIHTRGQAMYGFGNFSADGKRIPLTVTNASSPPELALGTLRGASLDVKRLSDLNGELLKQLQVAPAEMHWVAAPDGARTQTWVMKPANFKRGRKYPAILEVHGGPHAQYGVGFFHEFQLLAAQGNVVVFSNPRGSKGYGRDHCAAIRGHWGGADWIDVQAVTKFIKSLRFVNPKRVGIMGGSYGGYMTNWAIGHSQEYKAAITDRCVSNLVSMSGSSDYVEAPDLYWEGNAWDRPETRWNQSPLKYLGNARTPTLIIHSEGDLRCNIEQAEQVFSCLKLNKVPCRFVRYPSSTSHGMSRSGPPDLRLHRLNQILAWWRKWL